MNYFLIISELQIVTWIGTRVAEKQADKHNKSSSHHESHELV